MIREFEHLRPRTRRFPLRLPLEARAPLASAVAFRRDDFDSDGSVDIADAGRYSGLRLRWRGRAGVAGDAAGDWRSGAEMSIGSDFRALVDRPDATYDDVRGFLERLAPAERRQAIQAIRGKRRQARLFELAVDGPDIAVSDLIAEGDRGPDTPHGGLPTSVSQRAGTTDPGNHSSG